MDQDQDPQINSTNSNNNQQSTDVTMIDNNDHQPLSSPPPLPVSFKDAVAGNSQWFDEAKRIQISSLEWEDQDIDPPDITKAVQFPKVTLNKLRQP